MTVMRALLKLVGRPDELQLQRVAELASVAAGDAARRRNATGGGDLSEIDVTEFRACGPVWGEHVINASTHRPACLGLVLREDSNRRRVKTGARLSAVIAGSSPRMTQSVGRIVLLR